MMGFEMREQRTPVNVKQYWMELLSLPLLSKFNWAKKRHAEKSSLAAFDLWQSSKCWQIRLGAVSQHLFRKDIQSRVHGPCN